MKLLGDFAPLALALGLATTLCACGIGSLGGGAAAGTTDGNTLNVGSPHTTVSPSPGPTGGGTPSVTPTYALRGRFSPGDSNLLAPQAMSWNHASIVARVSGTTNVGVNITNVQGSGAYTLTAQNETDSAASPVSVSFDPGVSAGALSGLDPNAVYTVTLLKHIEAAYATATFVGFTLDAGATYLPAAAASARRIEIIGDSISAGYGNLGANNSCTASAANEDSEKAYGPVAAATLGADLHLEAWQGRGMYENYGGSRTQPMPEIWRRADATDANTVWDTSRWVPQVVVINLGTNDFTNTGLDQAAFVQAYTTFLAALRTDYPKAVIIASIGPMLSGTELSDCVTDMQQAIAARQTAGDRNVYLLQYAVEDTNTGAGCEYHPNVATDASMASALVSKINSVVQW